VDACVLDCSLHFWFGIRPLFGKVFKIGSFEEFTDFLLLKLVFLRLKPAVEPLRILDAGHRVEAILDGGWNCHDFENRAGQSSLVVVPVQDRSDVEVFHGRVFGPLSKEFFH
jgi:hypothetical protein